jgi:hypothetical protein
MRSGALALALSLLGLATAAPAALGNGDPPSQTLIREDVYPPAEAAAPGLVRDLQTAARRARDAGYPAKVAVVQSQLDLGNLATAFGKPQEYADYLAGDLGTHPDVADEFALLVVMPAGAGIAGKPFDGGEREAARTIDVSAGANSDQLVRAAQTTLEKMAAAGGHSIGGAGGSGGSGSSTGVVIGVLGGLILLTVLLAAAARARRQATPEAEE